MAVEIERKFLVLDSSYKHEAFSSSHICQGYICSERGRTVRIRIRNEHAYITIKGPSLNGGLSRYEFEQEIPLEDARKLMTLCDPGIIDKTRCICIIKLSVFYSRFIVFLKNKQTDIQPYFREA